MVAPLIAAILVAAAGAAALGVGLTAGAGLGDIAENIGDTLDVSIGDDGKPSVTVALQEILATPAILAPLVTVLSIQGLKVFQELAKNPELPKVMVLTLMSLSKKQRQKLLLNEVS